MPTPRCRGRLRLAAGVQRGTELQRRRRGRGSEGPRHGPHRDGRRTAGRRTRPLTSTRDPQRSRCVGIQTAPTCWTRWYVPTPLGMFIRLAVETARIRHRRSIRRGSRPDSGRGRHCCRRQASNVPTARRHRQGARTQLIRARPLRQTPRGRAQTDGVYREFAHVLERATGRRSEDLGQGAFARIVTDLVMSAWLCDVGALFAWARSVR